MYVCVWIPDWSTAGASAAELRTPSSELREDGSVAENGTAGESTRIGELASRLAEVAPRLRFEGDLVWADGRGLDAAVLAERLLDRLADRGLEARAGIAAVPVCAELAARHGSAAVRQGENPIPFLVKERTGWGWRTHPHPREREPVRARRREREPERVRVRLHGVPPRREREWLASLPLEVLLEAPRLRALLEGVGITTLGSLAELEREAVEVRFGAEVVLVWRLARADDRRILFRPIPPERPHGSIDFVDYVLTDPARLLFTANALLGPLCDRLRARGEHARALRLVLPLADGSEWERSIRSARPTASRETWLRLVRGQLERLTVPDAVAGMSLEVWEREAAGVRQGDLFDRGFATASTVEAAVARLAERQVLPVVPSTTSHPVIERRSVWRRAEGVEEGKGAGGRERTGLTLQLLDEPRRLGVETMSRRDHEVPVRIRDRGAWSQVMVSAGPDRISGGQWEDSPYAREYHRCITREGIPLWIYRDGRDGSWYLHGYWD